ncbi:MAG TPA: Gfo/Idh/MocA family oxidoreductase [Armatimonadota bacterium]|jgi:predicted dehydrogenase
MSSEINRREFLQRAAIVTVGAWVAGGAAVARKVSPNEKLNIGVIGVANQGNYSLENVKSENIVALCDINDDYLAAAAKDLPGAKLYNDFRKMLERDDIDAVTVATTDHTHFHAAYTALESGKHVYCEKPLTHTVAEARRLAETAKRRKRVTQMGTQIHATANYRRVVEAIQGGAIGAVTESHHWAAADWSGQGRVIETPPCPDTIHWDLWLGPAAERPYSPAYIPGSWRGWWAFGGGGLADMACHHMDLGFWALDLKRPTSVWTEGPDVDPETAPHWTVAHYEFPARGSKPPVKLTWYNGAKRPAYFEEKGRMPEWGNGSLFVGEKGMLLADYDHFVLLPEGDFKAYEAPKHSIPDSIGHHAEWISACKTGAKTTCNFDYSGALTEAVNLANVSYRSGKKIDWDARNLKAKGAPEADAFIHPTYRKGWEI